MKTSELLELLAQENIEIKNLPELLVNALAKKKKRIATAESCTGGLLSGAITSVSGASGVFDCGVCSYANHIKHKIVGVREETLAAHGAVSEEVAREMAEGLRARSGCDIAVSTTGIAGPDGGTPEKPVGLVYIGCAAPDRTWVEALHLTGDRARIRSLAALRALDMLRRAALRQ